jgi:hypothetical protein
MKQTAAQVVLLWNFIVAMPYSGNTGVAARAPSPVELGGFVFSRLIQADQKSTAGHRWAFKPYRGGGS